MSNIITQKNNIPAYNTTVRKMNQTKNTQTAVNTEEVRELLEKFKLLSALCDIKHMINVIRNLNNRLKNCKNQISKEQIFLECINDING